MLTIAFITMVIGLLRFIVSIKRSFY